MDDDMRVERDIMVPMRGWGGVPDLDFSIATSRMGNTLQPPTSRSGTLPVHAPALLGHRPMSPWPIFGASLDEGLKARG